MTIFGIKSIITEQKNRKCRMCLISCFTFVIVSEMTSEIIRSSLKYLCDPLKGAEWPLAIKKRKSAAKNSENRDPHFPKTI